MHATVKNKLSSILLRITGIGNCAPEISMFVDALYRKGGAPKYKKGLSREMRKTKRRR
jgi:hypothetical protein